MIKKILTHLILLSLVCIVLVGAKASGQSQTTSTDVPRPLCSEEGDYIYNDEEKGPTSCCSGFVSGLVTGAPSEVVGRCTSNCVAKRESLGAVVPENDKQCCAGLEPYVPKGVVGTRGICMECAGEGDNVYINDSDGPANCCSGLTLDPIVGSSVMKGRCIADAEIQPSCLNFPGPSFCPGGIDNIIVTGTNSEGCSIYGCKNEIQPSCLNFPGPSFCLGGIDDVIVTGTDDEGCSIYGCKNKTQISIAKKGDGVIIRSGEVEVVTSEKVSVTNSKLLIETSTGTKEIKIMPEEISEILGTNSIEFTELKEESKKVIYSVTGTKKAKVLMMFPIKIKFEAKINAETGEIISLEKPWWSFLTKEF